MTAALSITGIIAVLALVVIRINRAERFGPQPPSYRADGDCFPHTFFNRGD